MNRILYIVFAFSALSNQLFAQTNNEANKAANYNNSVGNVNLEMANPTLDVRSSGYFKKEADEFEAQAKQTPSSAQAWLNYYKSSLYSFYTSSSKTLTTQQKEELTDILAEMKAKVPASFEYNLAVYLNGQHNTNLIGYLANAAEMNSNNIDVVEQYVAYYAITNNDSKLKEYVSKHRKLSKYESFIDEYGYNLLQSLESNAVLFTHGVLDTYPLYNQQLAQKVNVGVEIINIDYLNSEEFRKNISKKLGVTFSYTGNNYATAFEIASKLKSSRGIYFSNAFSKTELKKHEKELDLSGLALKFSDNKTDVSNIVSLWTTKFKKTEVEKVAMTDDYAKKMANNYLPTLITVYKYYTTENKTKEATAVKNLAIKIAKVNGNEKQVNDLFN